MDHFTAHRLRFQCRAIDIVELNEHKGSAIRGAFFRALMAAFCLSPLKAAGQPLPLCAECPFLHTCPVAFLVSTMNPESDYGVTVPRPYTVQPPLGSQTRYEPGEPLAFGLTLYARAMNLFPYVILAARRFEQDGIGRKVAENRHRRGRLAVQAIWAENPLTGERQPVLRQGETLVSVPNLPICDAHIRQESARRAGGGARLVVEFRTPTRLVAQKELVKKPLFKPLFQRLLERLEALCREFTAAPLQADFRELVRRAEGVRLVDDGTHWVELRSYSTRLQRATPIGGFVGHAVYECADWSPFLPYLLWAQFTHVGKDAVKGNGWLVVH